MDFEIGETIYRHGDVHLKAYEGEVNSPLIAQALLHKGQNHHHSLRGNFKMEENEKVKLLEVIDPTELFHEEHATIVLKPGKYQIDIQQEYDHWEEESRSVID